MKKFTINKYLAYVIGIIFFFFLWWIISLIIDERVMIFPDPYSTFVEMIKILQTSYVYKCFANSLSRLLIGFGISFILALIFGIIAGNSLTLKRIFTPTIVSLKSIPTASLVFLFLVLVGAKAAPILMVILISFPILYESFVGGIENMDKDVIKAMKLDSGSSLRNVFFIQIPLLIPYLLVGITSSFALSFKIEIMAEILTGDTRSGIGSAILGTQINNPTDMTPIFAYSLIVIIFVLIVSLLTKFIVNKIKKKYDIGN